MYVADEQGLLVHNNFIFTFLLDILAAVDNFLIKLNWISVGGRHRGGRGGHDALVGTTVKVRQGPFKGYRGRVVDVKGPSVRVELESQMKVITGKFLIIWL